MVQSEQMDTHSHRWLRGLCTLTGGVCVVLSVCLFPLISPSEAQQDQEVGPLHSACTRPRVYLLVPSHVLDSLAL